MKRRQFITLLGGAAAWPLAAHTQQSERMRRIGVLLNTAADDMVFQTRVGAFLQGLALLGWTIGRNMRLRSVGLEARRTRLADTRRNWPRLRPTSFLPTTFRA